MKRIRNEEGIAALEFIFIFPILLVIMFGIMEFGWWLFRQEIITNASREGARAGIIQSTPKPSESDIQNVVKTYLAGATMGDSSKCVPSGTCATVDGEGGAFGTDLRVTVGYQYDFLIFPVPLPNWSASTLMKHE